MNMILNNASLGKLLFFPFLILLFFSTYSYSQSCTPAGFFPEFYPYNFNPSNNTFNIFNIGCDPCIYGLEGSDVCKCKKDCDPILDDCVQYCRDTTNGIQALVDCVEQCELQHRNCVNLCGDQPSKQKNAISYDYRLAIWWNDGLIGTSTGPPQFFFVSPIISGEPPSVVTVNLPDTNFLSKAHCFVSFLRVFYDDGSCCIFINSKCVDIG